MRILLISADIVMGFLLGIFLYVAVSKTWSSLDNPVVGILAVGVSVVMVLFRRPNGSLARRRGQDSGV